MTPDAPPIQSSGGRSVRLLRRTPVVRNRFAPALPRQRTGFAGSRRVPLDPDRELMAAMVATHCPKPVDGAEWQAGVTPGNERFAVLLNGDPQPTAFAASRSEGWVMVYVPADEISAYRRTDPLADRAKVKRLEGDVVLRRLPYGY